MPTTKRMHASPLILGILVTLTARITAAAAVEQEDAAGFVLHGATSKGEGKAEMLRLEVRDEETVKRRH